MAIEDAEAFGLFGPETTVDDVPLHFVGNRQHPSTTHQGGLGNHPPDHAQHHHGRPGGAEELDQRPRRDPSGLSQKANGAA
jgi:hypothetical protein